MLQVYTGSGKGKTTAALGLALRALGAGQHVYIMQFMKSLAYSEQKILAQLPGLELHTSGKPFFIAPEGTLDERSRRELGDDIVVFPPGEPPADYVALIARGLAAACDAIASGRYELVILDELNVALHFGLVAAAAVRAAVAPSIGSETLELVTTGRAAPAWLIEAADLVTDMQEVKHYYARGVAARKGVED